MGTHPDPASPPGTSAVGFARLARLLAAEARRLGLTAPGFRSPPRLPGTDRTIRRAPFGAVVSVRLKGRPLDAVITDMVDGVVAANRLEGDASRRTRVLLLQAVRDGDVAAARPAHPAQPGRVAA